MLSGRGLGVGLITRPEESYRKWPKCQCEASIMRLPWSTSGCCAMERKGIRNNQSIKTVSNGKRRIYQGKIFIYVLFQVMLSGYHAK